MVFAKSTDPVTVPPALALKGVYVRVLVISVFVSVTAPFLVLKVVTPEAPTDIV